MFTEREQAIVQNAFSALKDSAAAQYSPEEIETARLKITAAMLGFPEGSHLEFKGEFAQVIKVDGEFRKLYMTGADEYVLNVKVTDLVAGMFNAPTASAEKTAA